MSIFNRNKKNAAQGKAGKADAKARGRATAKATAKSGEETSPQKVGVVSSVLPTGSDADEATPFSDIVAKRFGPSGKPNANRPAAGEATIAEPTIHSNDSSSGAVDAEAPSAARDHPHSVDPLFTSEEPELETDPMANIGRATTITGNIVAEEDLEIHGTIEGSVRLVEHQLTVGTDGLVKASVEASIVLVHGKITGDVTAADLVEVKPGGIVGGDVKAPRVIMHDGAVIVGGLDMSAALPSSANASHSGQKSDKESEKKTERPVLKKVELPPVHATDEKAKSNAKQG